MTTRAFPAQQDRGEHPPGISLLWPAGAPPRSSASPPLAADVAADLQLAEVIGVLVGSDGRPARRHERERLVQQTLSELTTDPETIAYRQEVVADLLASPALREKMAEIIPDLEALRDAAPTSRFQIGDDGMVQRLARELGSLELFVEVARRLEDALAEEPISATALKALRSFVVAVTHEPSFLALEAELPALRATFDQVKSVTVGINLTPDLEPESATILALSPDRVEGSRTLLGRLLGRQDAGRGITPLQRTVADGFTAQPNRLARDLHRLLEDVTAPVARALERFVELPTGVLGNVGPELALLLNGALLAERLNRAGLPMCRPEILPSDDRIAELCEAYDLTLALRLVARDGAPGGRGGATEDTDGIVTNAVTFDDVQGRIWILTGPNRSGKTTYTRAVGLAQVLFQAGLYVPASSARLSPVDAIFSHFPSHEQAQPGMGRLDEEARRLAEIFHQATPHSLVLLNETLAGTAASEAEALARDALRGLRLLGARAIYVTHLHDLAATVDELNASTPGTSLVGSLVADAEDDDEDAPSSGHHRRTFRIHPGSPRGRSYASDIARHYGISFPQLAALLRERGISAARTGTSCEHE